MTLSTWQRVLLACVSLVSATFLLWPPPAKPRTVTWEDLLLPLSPGAHITRGYVLSLPRRGEERDVVFMARRDDGAHVEVHVIDKGQWSGVRETKSFGVGYETPRSQASTDDLEAVTETIADHLRANDIGFAQVSTIPLAADPSPPWMTRTFEHAQGMRGGIALALMTITLGFVASMKRRGDVVAALFLFLLGLGLRLPNLDVPFTHDQDVQRFFTGQYPLLEILTGNGLDDRHPPLWFVVLHAAGLFGQTETIARLPAVFAGALIGPAIVWATHRVRGQGGVSAAMCGFVATISPEFVKRSREVSEIPFFSVLVILAITLSLRLSSRSSSQSRRALVVVTALLAWTYYLAPLVLLAIVLALALTRRLNKDVLGALGWGSVLGAPAFLLGARIIVRDHGARTVAAQFPGLAWGERSSFDAWAEMGRQTLASVGAPIVVAVVISSVLAWRFRRDAAPFVAVAVLLTTALGIAIAAQFARVQSYYISAVLPVLPLAVALGPSPRNQSSPVWWIVCAACFFSFARVSLPAIGGVYVADADAFMPRFASVVLQRSESRIIVIAHYDATLLAYYLERAAGGKAAWPNVSASGEFVLPTSRRRVLALARVHELNEQSGETSLATLRAALEQEPALVIERDAFVLKRVHRELATCDVWLEAPSARLLRCSARSPH